MIQKFSVIQCPVCGQKGKTLKDVEEDEKIFCRNCGGKTRAARWTKCDWPSLPHEDEARVRKKLDETICHAKQLAEAINMSKEELVRMIQE